MPACCSTFESAADQQFNEKKAAKELARYRQKGPGRTTRLLRDALVESGALADGTLLDIGSGVGPLTFELLDCGISRAVAVDASSACVAAARSEAERTGQAGVIRFVHGDVVAIAPYLPPASVVTLDRVVCCYPSCDTLLALALRHAERCIALSYPRDVWYVRLGMALDNAQRRAARNSFRTFVHPVARMQQIISAAGFELSGHRETWTWSIDVYVR